MGKNGGEFVIGGRGIAPGERVRMELPVVNLYTSAPVSLPLVVQRGKESGPTLFVSAALHGDEIIGVEIIRRALEEPIRKISSNAGVEGAVVIEKVKAEKGGFGYNARTEKYEDLEKSGVIDPTKVERTALQNAASVASLLLTTEAMIAEKPKKKAKAGGVGGGMPDYGGEDMDY